MRREVDAVAHPRSSARRSLPWALFQSLRPKQWTKNGLLFLGLIFSLSLHDPHLIVRAVLAFVDFCLLASATYLINDVVDIERDRLHPIKRSRPIASGQVSRGLALWTALLLFGAGVVLALYLGAGFSVAAMLYPLLTVSYSLWLKHLVIIDVMAIAAGFVLRAAAGAVAISVPISPWLYACTLFGALFIAVAKRRHEITLLQGGAGEHRKILEAYTLPFLDQTISILASASIIAYSFYTFTAENLPRNQWMMLTIPFVLFGVFRYLYLIHMKGGGGTPEEALLSDRPLLVTVIGWGLVSTAIVYLLR